MIGIPQKGRGVRLDNLSSVRRELARLYRAAKAGEIRPEDATRLAYLLQILSRILEVEKIEHRLDRVERLLPQAPLKTGYANRPQQGQPDLLTVNPDKPRNVP